MGFQKCFVLMFRVPMGLPFFVEQIGKFSRLKGMRFEKSIALLDEAVLLGKRTFGGIKLPGRVLQLPLELRNRLVLISKK